MHNDEYKAFLEYLFHTYIRDRLHRIERYWDGPHGGRMWHYETGRLRRAMHIIRYIQLHCDNDDDIYATFKAERLRRVVGDVRGRVLESQHLADAGGFLDAIDEHYAAIVAGMTLGHFPESELGVLRDLGSDDPTRDIQAMIHILKTRLPTSEFPDQPSVRTQLDRVEAKLSEALEAMRENEDQAEAPKKSRRWFKGLGQMAQGAALSLADIGLAAGVFQFPVSPETQTWGALVSTTTGVGMIMTGFGELRGE